MAMFLLAFALMLILYPWIIKVYHPAVLGTANFVMEKLDPPTRLEMTYHGGWRAFDTSRGLKRSVADWYWWQPYLHFLSLPLLPALLIATPAPWRTRFKLLAICFPLLFLVHSATMIGVVRAHYCFMIDRKDFGCLWMLRAVNTSGQLFGVGLWALLTWQYWIPRKHSRPS